MITRLVKLTFKHDQVDVFLQIFNSNKELIRNFKGCHSLELLQDQKAANVFWTMSHWDSENQLNAYRNSELFSDVWSRTKVLFENKAEAWSLNSLFKSSVDQLMNP